MAHKHTRKKAPHRLLQNVMRYIAKFTRHEKQGSRKLNRVGTK